MRIFYIFLIFIINICIVNAEIDIFKQEYSPKETFQAELNFEDLVEEIKSSDIVILNSASQPTNVGILLTKITKKRYFVYFDIPEIAEGNYFLAVKNVKYLENGILKKENFIKEFQIEKDGTLISIKPPYTIFIPEEKNFFKIDIKNNGNNVTNIRILEESNATNLFNNNLTIAKNSEDSFYFNLIPEKIQDRDKLNIRLTYDKKIFFIPIFILKEHEKENLLFYTVEEQKKTYLDSYKAEIPFGNYAESSLFLENNLNKKLVNLTFSLTEDIKDMVKLGFYNIELLETNKSLELTFFINQNRNKEKGIYAGNLIIQNNEINKIFPVKINIIESQLYQQPQQQTPALNLTQAETQLPQEIEQQEINRIMKKAEKLDKKTISYISIAAVILLFLFIYVLLYIKTGRKRKF